MCRFFCEKCEQAHTALFCGPEVFPDIWLSHDILKLFLDLNVQAVEFWCTLRTSSLLLLAREPGLHHFGRE